ncbi:MAG TPA: NADPH-dependent F420 reductase [Dehalococcoidia bacterium]|jgi:NADPH-dependent F420 reductase|nr:NADPH-dependent F420 reductase [Dehalococcoidia bacterium]
MLAFLGGTGPEGRGLAIRLALAGEEVVIGSRDAARASTAAEELLLLAPGARITGAANADAAAQADTIFLTFPYEGQRPTLETLGEALDGKIVVNVIAPMEFQRGRGAIALPVDAGSAAEESQLLLPGALVAAAFQNASAEELQEPGLIMEGDVVICSDHKAAKDRVMELTPKIPNLRPVDGGALANAKYVEQITPLLVNINRIYKIHAGIKIVGV